MIKNILFLLISLCSLNAFSLSVGVTAGPHVTIMEEVKKEAKKHNINLEIIEFNDFILPNAALDQGDIDLNSYQHQQFLYEQINTRGYKLTSIAQTIILPLGIYSNKYSNLFNIKNGAKIALPNDPTNLGRALGLLKKAGLIELNDRTDPSVLDIISNEKRLKFIEIEAAQIPRILDDVDYGITNTDWIMLAGSDPRKALLTEDNNSPYANIIAVRTGDENNPEIRKIVDIYHSEHIKDFIYTAFRGIILPAW